MGRPKFSFPMPGRKSHTKTSRDNHDANSNRSIPSQPQCARQEDTSSFSKAERLLGASLTPPFSRDQILPSQEPGYMTITVSEASFGTDCEDEASTAAMEGVDFHHAKRLGMVHRPSSNILGNNYQDDGRRGSYASSTSRRVQAKNSNSTLRSYYDPHSAPPYVSQQTSASAVRDMALRKGYPQVITHQDGSHVLEAPLYIRTDLKKEHRKNKPVRLDLSKLFPKPRGNVIVQHTGALLSPTKLVNSPTALSTASERFPRPMTREPTPQPRVHTKLTKTSQRHHAPTSQPQPCSTSPIRLHKRDTYDNAKINVRRPPRGIQHWFEGLSEDSDEAAHKEDLIQVISPTPVTCSGPQDHVAPLKESSLDRLMRETVLSHRQMPHSRHEGSKSKKEQHLHTSPYGAPRLFSPSQSSLISAATKTSSFSKSNLHDSSVLSISSSEDEAEETPSVSKKFAARDSLDTMGDHGEIIIGKAQAFEVRPRYPRQDSLGKMSVLSSSTGAATIEVMYTPEPYPPYQYPGRPFGSRSSSHVRQPSVIPEDEGVRPKTSGHPPMSPTSVRSGRTSMSEPRPRPEGHKLMAVTEEEEALLEMMRRKRAAMAKQSFSDGYKTAMLVEEKRDEIRQKTPPEREAYRTSGFLAAETPACSPARAIKVTTLSKPKDKAPPLLLAPPRARMVKSARDLRIGTSILRNRSSCDPDSDYQLSSSPPTNLAHHLAPTPIFSPIDMFPSPVATPTDVSIASPTSTDHASPLPSPVTPGLRNGEADLDVKVASSEPSYNGDSDDVAVLETGVIDPPLGSIKRGDSSHDNIETATHHQRRRTASSGADITFSPTTAAMIEAFPTVLKTPNSSRLGSMVEPPLPRRSSKRLSKSTSISSFSVPRSGNSSIYSARTSSPGLGHFDRSRVSSIKRESLASSSKSSRCSVNSVSEDVLAAWSSLGGSRY